jgi:hypothetical protein
MRTTVKCRGMSFAVANVAQRALIHDEECGVLYVRRREWNYSLSHWDQREPNGGQYRDGLNLYWGFGDDPIDDVDPRGRDFFKISIWGWLQKWREERDREIYRDYAAAQKATGEENRDPDVGPIPPQAPLTPQVYICQRKADICGGSLLAGLGLYHEWIVIVNPGGSQIAGGMGNGNGVPGANGQTSPDWPYSKTYVVNHAGQPETQCYPVAADPDCVASKIQSGRYTGRWSCTNNCNTFASDIISQCPPK